jgi:uncharacterized protein YxeA
MKKLFFILAAVAFSLAVSAQGNSGNKGKSKNNPSVQTDNPGNNGNHGNTDKSKEKTKEKEDKAKNDDHDRKVWDGVDGGSGCGKISKNQPAKVRSNFARDYPNAINVRWTKCRGDWTATFNGVVFRSTAVYHANGDRRDTRTPVNQDNIPRRILDEILKKRPGTRLEDVIKIEVPDAVKEIFRIKNILNGNAQFEYYNADGLQVQYNY